MVTPAIDPWDRERRPSRAASIPCNGLTVWPICPQKPRPAGRPAAGPPAALGHAAPHALTGVGWSREGGERIPVRREERGEEAGRTDARAGRAGFARPARGGRSVGRFGAGVAERRRRGGVAPDQNW